MGRARERSVNSIPQYRAKMDTLSARRASLLRKVENAAADITRATRIIERALCDTCCVDKTKTEEENVAYAEMLSDKARKKCRILQKRLELIVDEYQWICRRYAELGSVKNEVVSVITKEE